MRNELRLLSETPPPDLRDRWILRLWLAGCQAAAIWLTWNLWQARGPGGPPNLPVVQAAWMDACQFSIAWPLLLSLVLAVVWPAVGVAAHLALLVLAIALDQMRIQPEFISVAILLAGTLARRGPLLLARCHLISLWCFAGLHKLAAPDYWTDTGPYLARTFFGQHLDERLAIAIGIAIACGELALGLAAVFPRTRRFVPVYAALIHVGILASLVAQQWNTAVWPWNFALAASGFGFFRGFSGPLLAWPKGDSLFVIPAWTPGLTAAPTRRPEGAASAAKLPMAAAPAPDSRVLVRSWQVLAVFVLLHPALYYLGLADAYVSWCVYSSNTPDASYVTNVDPASWTGGHPPDWLLDGAGEELLFREYGRLNVPFTPSPRVYRQYLLRTGRVGDAVVIRDPRPPARLFERREVVLIKQKQGVIEVVAAPRK